jgi:hypothetical protein
VVLVCYLEATSWRNSTLRQSSNLKVESRKGARPVQGWGHKRLRNHRLRGKVCRKALGVPLHPGAAEYCGERGYMKSSRGNRLESSRR